MHSIFDQIMRLSNERLELYRLAGRQKITEEQRRRIGQINFELPGLWDRHRREVAAARYGKQSIPTRRERAA